MQHGFTFLVDKFVEDLRFKWGFKFFFNTFLNHVSQEKSNSYVYMYIDPFTINYSLPVFRKMP